MCFYLNEKLIFRVFGFDVTTWVLQFFVAGRAFRGGTQAQLETSSDLWFQDNVKKYISHILNEEETHNVTYILHILNEEGTHNVTFISHILYEEGTHNVTFISHI